MALKLVGDDLKGTTYIRPIFKNGRIVQVWTGCKLMLKHPELPCTFSDGRKCCAEVVSY